MQNYKGFYRQTKKNNCQLHDNMAVNANLEYI